MTRAQTISATRAVQMMSALKRAPRMATELVAITGLQQATVERWLAHMQLIGSVRAGGADGMSPWFRWITPRHLVNIAPSASPISF